MSQTDIKDIIEMFPGRFEYLPVGKKGKKADCVGYHQNGTPEFKYTMVEGVLHGAGMTWHENGQLQCEEAYVYGRPHGAKTEWFPSGTMSSKAFFINGRLHGTGTKWYESGLKRREEVYVEGRLEGKQRTWYPSGILKMEAYYSHGRPQSSIKEWHENGNLRSVREYARGRLHGDGSEWYPSGKIRFRTTYRSGQRNGISRGWDEDGKLLYTKIFVHDVSVSQKTADLLHSGRLTARYIIETHNTAVRRILLEEYGYARFMAEVGYEIIDKDGEMELAKVDWDLEEEPLFLVKVKCATTGAFYTLRVPPRMRTVKQAVAWTFGQTPKTYNPIAES
jgi:antitoxin component YwqK of YwqJK toxin-antitoxin module